jgi:DNA-binding transcriptional ArsR family regulator
MIFASLKHPIRRRILRILSGGPQTFSDLQKTFAIESSHLTYHLDGLGNLLLKTDDGKYALSSLGEAAVSTMKHVEEPPKATLHLQFPSRNWKLLTAAMLVGLILLSTLLVFQHQSLSELSARYSSLSEEQKLLQEALKDVGLYFGGAVVTSEHTVNDSIATALLQKEGNFTEYVYIMNVTDVMNETGWVLSSVKIWNENESATFDVTIFNVTTPWGHNIDMYSIYSLTGNSTLRIGISVNSSQPQASAYLSIDNSLNSANQTFAGSLEGYFHLWDKEVTGNATFSVPLPSAGHYVLRIEAPGVWEADGHYETSYTMTLSMESQGNPAPFIVGNRTEEASTGWFIGTPNTTPLLLSRQWLTTLNTILLISP